MSSARNRDPEKSISIFELSEQDAARPNCLHLPAQAAGQDQDRRIALLRVKSSRGARPCDLARLGVVFGSGGWWSISVASLWGSSAAPTPPALLGLRVGGDTGEWGSYQPRPAAAGCASPQAPGRVLSGRRAALIGWAVAAAAARGDPVHSPAEAAECPGARRERSSGARPGRTKGSRGRAAAASVAMCAQVWLLTDRLIREDYPQVQILRALRQRCSEQDVRFRAVFLDQIAVTVVCGHLGLQLSQKPLTTFPDVVVVRLSTPSVQSDSEITILRHLEKLGCRLINRPQSILNCINKFWTFQELAGHGVPMPDTFSYGGHEDFSKMIDEAEPLGYPVVVKSTRGHRGKAVFLARDKHHLSDICHLVRHDVPYLFQKYVKESHGKDIRVVVVGGQVIGSMLRCSTDGRMQSNCFLGGVGVKCPLTEQGKQLAIQVSNILGMDFCGIDLLIMDDGSFVVCEANANVGFLAFDQACNLDVGAIIADYAMSLLPNRQMGKMAILPGLSSPREKNEPNGCASAQGVENVYAINNGSTSSESEPELGEVRDSSAKTMVGVPPPHVARTWLQH